MSVIKPTNTTLTTLLATIIKRIARDIAKQAMYFALNLSYGMGNLRGTNYVPLFYELYLCMKGIQLTKKC